MTKILKVENKVDWSSRNVKIAFYEIIWANLDFQFFSPAVIPSEGGDFRAL